MTPTVILIDRLVDGDLDPEARRALLLRLDIEPDGWRRCALAFLEDQCWRESLGPTAREAVPESAGAARPPRRRPRLARGSALAAGLLAAFAVGWSAGQGGRPDREFAGSPAPVAVIETRRPDPSPVEASALAQTTPDEPPAPLPAASPDERWQERGYRIERGSALMTVGLKDGRRVAMPVERVKLRYVGEQIY